MKLAQSIPKSVPKKDVSSENSSEDSSDEAVENKENKSAEVMTEKQSIRRPWSTDENEFAVCRTEPR